jgi:hypothetical protein
MKKIQIEETLSTHCNTGKLNPPINYRIPEVFTIEFLFLGLLCLDIDVCPGPGRNAHLATFEDLVPLQVDEKDYGDEGDCRKSYQSFEAVLVSRSMCLGGNHGEYRDGRFLDSAVIFLAEEFRQGT